jgi:hypothetical protein
MNDRSISRTPKASSRTGLSASRDQDAYRVAGVLLDKDIPAGSVAALERVARYEDEQRPRKRVPERGRGGLVEAAGIEPAHSFRSSTVVASRAAA